MTIHTANFSQEEELLTISPQPSTSFTIYAEDGDDDDYDDDAYEDDGDYEGGDDADYDDDYEDDGDDEE